MQFCRNKEIQYQNNIKSRRKTDYYTPDLNVIFYRPKSHNNVMEIGSKSDAKSDLLFRHTGIIKAANHCFGQIFFCKLMSSIRQNVFINGKHM